MANDSDQGLIRDTQASLFIFWIYQLRAIGTIMLIKG